MEKNEELREILLTLWIQFKSARWLSKIIITITALVIFPIGLVFGLYKLLIERPIKWLFKRRK